MDKEVTEKWFDAIGAGGEALRALILNEPLHKDVLVEGLEEQEWAMVLFLNGVTEGHIEGGRPITQEDVERIRKLRSLIAHWEPTAPPSHEMVAIAEQLISWFFGPDWRTEFRPRGSVA